MPGWSGKAQGVPPRAPPHGRAVNMDQLTIASDAVAMRVRPLQAIASAAGCSGASDVRLWSRSWRRAAAMLALATAACAGPMDPAGPVARANRLILFDALGIMLAIVVPTIVATIAFAWWFREGNTRAKYRPDFVYSGRLELIIWAIPILTILFLGGVIWIGSHQLDPAKPLASKVKPLEVQVVSLDWKWLFIYPAQGVASVNELAIPAGVPVHFALTSSSVMNTFFVPQLGSQIYTMNGMATNLNLQADRPGEYRGQSSHFSGDGFSDMVFTVRALPPAGFAGWVNAARAGGPVLDAPGYRALARQSKKVAPFTYRAVQPNLFQAVVMQQLPPAAGPQEGRGGPQTSPGARR